MKEVRVLRRVGVSELTSLSRPTIYRLIKSGNFPKPIRLSANAVGWDIRDIHNWIESRKSADRGVAA